MAHGIDLATAAALKASPCWSTAFCCFAGSHLARGAARAEPLLRRTRAVALIEKFRLAGYPELILLERGWPDRTGLRFRRRGDHPVDPRTPTSSSPRPRRAPCCAACRVETGGQDWLAGYRGGLRRARRGDQGRDRRSRGGFTCSAPGSRRCASTSRAGGGSPRARKPSLLPAGGQLLVWTHPNRRKVLNVEYVNIDHVIGQEGEAEEDALIQLIAHTLYGSSTSTNGPTTTWSCGTTAEPCMLPSAIR